MTTLGRFIPLSVIPLAQSFLLLALALCSFTLGGCATGAVARTATAADLTADDADRIVEAYRNRHEIRAASTDPLREPKSLDDVLEILRLDQIDLFGPATKFAVAEGSPRGQALAAQILLAWGDAQHLLGTLLTRASKELEERRAHLEHRRAAGKLNQADEERLAHAEKSLKDLAGVERALHRVASKHIQDGITLAEKVIAAAPNDYEGYRVAADYYHLREDWPKFEAMMKQLETLKPDSNGLVFLKAEAARDRDHDRVESVMTFRDALKRDPKFTRAQVAVLMLQPDMNGAHAELQKLKKINPNHQIVLWMGPTIEREYLEWKEVNERRRNRLNDMATPGAQ